MPLRRHNFGYERCIYYKRRGHSRTVSTSWGHRSQHEAADARFIAVSGLDSKGVLEKAVKAGFHDYFMKPVNPEPINRTISA